MYKTFLSRWLLVLTVQYFLLEQSDRVKLKKKFDSFITNTEDSHKQSSLFICGLCADADCIALNEQIIVAITL
jgi:hypothetical protein